MDTLRGNSGANFENEAIVTRGDDSGIGLFSCFDKNNILGKKKYILVKGPHVFVFNKVTSPTPKFAIPLKHETVNVHVSSGKTQVVALETGLGDVEYKFKFDLRENDNVGKEFGRVLREQILIGNSDEVKEVRYMNITTDEMKTINYYFFYKKTKKFFLMVRISVNLTNRNLDTDQIRNLPLNMQTLLVRKKRTINLRATKVFRMCWAIHDYYSQPIREHLEIL